MNLLEELGRIYEMRQAAEGLREQAESAAYGSRDRISHMANTKCDEYNKAVEEFALRYPGDFAVTKCANGLFDLELVRGA